MIYNTRNQSNDTTESQKEKRPVLMFLQEENETWLPNVKQANKYDVVIKKLSYVWVESE